VTPQLHIAQSRSAATVSKNPSGPKVRAIGLTTKSPTGAQRRIIVKSYLVNVRLFLACYDIERARERYPGRKVFTIGRLTVHFDQDTRFCNWIAMHHDSLFETSRPPLEPKGKNIFDLPAEIRNEIYKLVVESTEICILKSNCSDCNNESSLALTARQVRKEVLPLRYRFGRLHACIVDLEFEGLLAFTTRLTSLQRKHLCGNPNLEVRLRRSRSEEIDACISNMSVRSLKAWAVDRARVDQPQPSWKYTGPYTNHNAALEARREAEEQGDKIKHEYADVLQVWGTLHYRE
jgi:hypothetical protein